VRRTGIALEALRYQSPDLAALPLGATVRIKYDPADLGAIHAFDAFDAGPPGRWVRIPAVDQGYAQGLSLWAPRVIRARVLRERGSVDMGALAAAKARIGEIVAQEYARTSMRARGREGQLRWRGCPSLPSHTLAVAQDLLSREAGDADGGDLAHGVVPDLLEDVGVLLGGLLHTLGHALRVGGVHLALHLRGELLHELLALVLRHLLEVLAVGLLLHLRGRVLGELLDVAGGLVLVDLAVVAGVAGLGVLLILLLVVLVEREHRLILLVWSVGGQRHRWACPWVYL